MRTGLLFLWLSCTFLACNEKAKVYKIYGSVEEPQASVVQQFAKTINTFTEDSIVIIPPTENDRIKSDLLSGKVDFAVLNNFSTPSKDLRAVIPLYPRILHILIRKEMQEKPLSNMLRGKKIYAGDPTSSSYKLIQKIQHIYQIPDREVEFLSFIEIFKADIIVSFTDLLTIQELRDLDGYKLYSLDKTTDNTSSAALGLAIHFPQIQPYIIPKDTYGRFTPEAVITLRDLAILTVRYDIDKERIYKWMKLFREHKQEFATINPLISSFSNDFNPDDINQVVHEGSLDFLNRYEPSFLERYAEVLSVFISIMVALISGVYTFTQWQRTQKKNKIDVYYIRLIKLRERISAVQSTSNLTKLQCELRDIQNETFDLLIKEKLLANESFSILLNLTTIVQTELNNQKKIIESHVELAPS